MFCFKSLLLWGCALVCATPLSAQYYFGPNGSTVVPTPGSGHDYIHNLSETVDPASGSVSLRINIPVPPGRGMTLPFNLAYDTNGLFFPTSVGGGNSVGLYLTYYDAHLLDFQSDPAKILWVGASATAYAQNGWSYTFPSAGTPVQVSYPDYSAPQNPPENPPVCDTYVDWTFFDTDGSRHGLGMRTLGEEGTPQCLSHSPNLIGGFDLYTAVVSPAANAPYFGGGLTVADREGTTYFFGGGLCSLPTKVEDRNGNQITFSVSGPTASRPNCNGPVAETDTLHRAVLSASGFGSSGDTIAVSGVSGNYTVTWGSINVNYNVNAAIQGNSDSCNAIPTVSFQNEQVITSLTLPNGRSYKFEYDPTYGVVNKITYPSGGWVSYDWALSSQSAGASLPNAFGTAANQCDYVYDKPAVKTRRVSYDGSTIALQQEFAYTTSYTASTSLWTAKTTKVTSHDLAGGTTRVTDYSYQPTSSKEVLNTGETPVTNYDLQIPAEHQITYSDASGKVLRTVTKNWESAEIMTDETDSEDGGLPYKTAYKYHARLISEKDEYDYNASSNNPIRTTLTNFQTFAAPPAFQNAQTYNGYVNLPTILSMPCQTMVKDSSGNRVAETDYLYDGGTGVCGAAGAAATVSASGPIQHDAAYGASASLPRGNKTTETHWSNLGPSPTTSLSYDETGQVVSTTDPNGNVTQYRYNDSCTVGTPAGNTDAFLTEIDLPAVNGIVQKTTYCSRLADSQLDHSIDANARVTAYSYADVFGRLTETDLPDGGKTSIQYNDSPFSATSATPNVTMQRLVDGSTTATSIVARDGMDQPIKSITRDSQGDITTETSYDGFGSVLATTNPHRPSHADSSDGTRSFAYDGLGRKRYQCNPDNGTAASCAAGASFLEWRYGFSGSGATVTSFDEVRSSRSMTSDRLGRLVGITELGTPTSAVSLPTAYTYDALDNLTSVNQTGDGSAPPRALRTFKYDSLKRLVQSFNPESGYVCYGSTGGGAANGSNCTDTGYDANGNLISKTDARGISTSFLYDALNRLKSTTFSDETASACQAYDSGSSQGNVSNAIGRRTAAWTQVGSCPAQFSGIPPGVLTYKQVMSFDPMGRVTAEKQCPVAPCPTDIGTVAYTYNLAGEVTHSTNGMASSGSPGIGFTYAFDDVSRLKSITSDWSDSSHPATVFNADPNVVQSSQPTYSAFGIESAVLGTSSQSSPPILSRSRAYDSRGRVTSDAYQSGQQSPTAPSGAPVLTVSPLPNVAQGVAPYVTATCGDACGTGGGQFQLDEQYIGGFTYYPGAFLQTYISQVSIGPGPHSMQAIFSGDSTHPLLRTNAVSFTVVAPNLPTPTLGSVIIDPTPIPVGESANLTITNSCASACGEAYYTVDGNYAGTLVFDDTGVAGNSLPSNLTADTHTLGVHYYGNGQWLAADLPPYSFTVSPQALPAATINISVNPSPLPSDQYGTITIGLPCGSDCRGGLYFVDGNYAGGYTPDSSGNATGTINAGLSPDAQHTLTVKYSGDSVYGPNSVDYQFSTITDNLPVPTITPTQTLPLAASHPAPFAFTVTSPNISCNGNGKMFVDGGYVAYFWVDNYGTAYSQSFAVSAGQHSLDIEYYGSSTCHPQSLPVPITAQ